MNVGPPPPIANIAAPVRQQLADALSEVVTAFPELKGATFTFEAMAEPTYFFCDDEATEGHYAAPQCVRSQIQPSLC